jgi:hypothetical protein
LHEELRESVSAGTMKMCLTLHDQIEQSSMPALPLSWLSLVLDMFVILDVFESHSQTALNTFVINHVCAPQGSLFRFFIFLKAQSIRAVLRE